PSRTPRSTPHRPQARPYWPSPSGTPPRRPTSKYRTACLVISARPHDSSQAQAWLIERTTATDDPTPSLHPHYRGFLTTTSWSAGAPCDGTQSLTVSAAWDAPSRSPTTRRAVSRHAFSRSTRKQQIRLASSTCRTPPGQSAGTRQTHPGTPHTPRFRCHLFLLRHFINDSLALAFLIPT